MWVCIFEAFLFSLFALTLIHGIRRHDGKRLALAFGIIAFICAVEENLVMHFTGNYAYPSGYHLWIGSLPLAIMLAWMVVAYLGFLAASKLESLLLGALAASSIDVLLEPLAYYLGLWTWHPTVYSPVYYFSAPLQNAFGWFLLTLLGAHILKKSSHAIERSMIATYANRKR